MSPRPKTHVVLYGELAKRFGKHHEFAIKNVAEAIRALKANFKGFEKYLCTAHQDGMGFRVLTGESQLEDLTRIHDPCGAKQVIRIVPMILGAKSDLIKIFIGVSLVAAAVIATALTGGAASPTLALAIKAAGFIGASLIIGGVSGLLASPPPGEKSVDKKSSFLFNGPVNTTLQGAAVPVGYGRFIIGSCVISAGIEAHDE